MSASWILGRSSRLGSEMRFGVVRRGLAWLGKVR